MTDPEAMTVDPDVMRRLAVIFGRIDQWAERISNPDEVRPPDPGSRLALDDKLLTRHFQMSTGVLWALVSAVDHLNSLRRLVIDAQSVPSRGTFTLLRAALENGAVAVWLMAPRDQNERVLRRLRLQWADIKEQESAHQLIDHAATTPTRDKKRQLQDIGRAAGLSTPQVNLIASRPVGYATIVDAAAREGSAVDADAMVLAWRLCSGIAHAKSWAVLGLLERTNIQQLDEGMLRVRLTAPDHALFGLTVLAAATVHEGWKLFDHYRTHRS